ncbi:hypothetical protein DVDV_0599 [Desulfovibrio sp. DV]|nr:hypothetical protein DVDV_0599 [Desulfovibrio sp. DV]
MFEKLFNFIISSCMNYKLTNDAHVAVKLLGQNIQNWVADFIVIHT